MAEDRATSSPPIRLVIRAKLISAEEEADPGELKARWRPVPIVIAAVLLLALVAGGVYFFASGETQRAAKSPVQPAPRAAVETSPRESPAVQAPTAEAPPSPPNQVTPSNPPPAIHQVLPTVASGASATIRGTIRVSIRVIVDEDGNVVAATSEDPGPSRYFERLSLDAAKKWTFGPGEKRLMRVKFSYTRSGPAAEASLAR
jgi:hypothetical protein